MKYYYIYKITNLIDGKVYIGCHQTSNLDDGYMGSGKYLKRAQEKYGMENFEKEILHMYDNKESMFEMESVLVNSEFVSREDTYNLKEGGFGGWDYHNSNSDLQREKAYKSAEVQRELRKTNPEIYKKVKEKASETFTQMHKKRKEAGDTDSYKTFLGKSHNDETKKKIGEANSKHQSGKGNSQFGTMWIHNLDLKESKKIKKDEFSEWEAKGWLKGRKMKFF